MHSEKAPLGLQHPRGFNSNHNLMQKLLNEHYRVIMEEQDLTKHRFYFSNVNVSHLLGCMGVFTELSCKENQTSPLKYDVLRCIMSL